MKTPILPALLLKAVAFVLLVPAAALSQVTYGSFSTCNNGGPPAECGCGDLDFLKSFLKTTQDAEKAWKDIRDSWPASSDDAKNAFAAKNVNNAGLASKMASCPRDSRGQLSLGQFQLPTAIELNTCYCQNVCRTAVESTAVHETIHLMDYASTPLATLSQLKVLVTTRFAAAVLTQSEVNAHHAQAKFLADKISALENACGASCVPAGTPVTLASGEQVPIEGIKVGDRVLAVELDAGRTTPATVEAVLVHDDGPFSLDRLIAASGDELLVTPNHPVWTVATGYVPASELAPGDVILRINPATSLPEPVELIAIIRAESKVGVVYNLKTSRSQYVAASVVVHNKCVARGTPVDTPAGAAPIETLRPGDVVYGTSDGRRVPTRVLRVFDKRTVLAALPGKRLGPTLVVTNNHVIATAGGDVVARALPAPDAQVTGPVYDLQTESGDYFSSGVRLRGAKE